MRNTKYKFILAVLLMSNEFVSAQQETYLTHAAFNKVLTNPAFAGYGGWYEVSTFHHRQWLNLKDHTGRFYTQDFIAPNPEFPLLVRPVTTGFTASAPITVCRSGNKIEMGGFAISAIQDIIAYENNTHIKASVAHFLKINQHSGLRTGLEFNVQNRRINAAMLRAHQNPDPLIPVGNIPGDTRIIPGAGLMYFNDKWSSFYAGLSFNGITRPEFSYLNQGGYTTKIRAATHAIFIGGAEFKLNNRQNIMLHPTAILRSVNNSNGWILPQMELQCLAEYRQQFALGTSFRFQKNGSDAVCLLLGFYPNNLNSKINDNLRIGYSYDITLQSLRLSSRNTHEIQINYRFYRPCRPHVQIRHPRDMVFHDKGKTGFKRKRFFKNL